MTMNKKLYNKMRKYFYRVMIKSDAYYAATYTFEGSEQNRFTAQQLADIYNGVGGYKAFLNGDMLVIINRDKE